MNEKKSKGWLGNVGMLLFWLILLGILGFPVWGMVAMVWDAEHYRRVYEHPLTVQAVVIDHDSYDDDGDTDYRSYVRYTVDGKVYTDIKYEDEGTKDKLTPIGTTVEVEVSSEDPSKLLSQIASNGGTVFVVWVIVSILLAGGIQGLIQSRRSRDQSGTPDRDRIVNDLKLSICGRRSLLFWLVLVLGWGVLCWRYPMILGSVFQIACGVAALPLGWCVISAIRDTAKVNNEEYELRYSVLERKEIEKDDDIPIYVLYYRDGEKTWKTKTKKSVYEKIELGNTVLAVFLNGRKKPVLHYDIEGDAC